MRYCRYISLLSVLLLFGCGRMNMTENRDEEGILPGDEVMFTSYVPDAVPTKTAKDDWLAEVEKYKPLGSGYDFSVQMFREGAADPLAAGDYEPAGDDGTMIHTGSGDPLVWDDNVSRFGFMAEANKNPLAADQSTEDKWLAMDYLRGYSYIPLWTGDDTGGRGTDPDGIMYLSSKEWYAANKESSALTGLMVNGNEDYKKVPLYMKHQRAWITVILKAGEGVSREALRYETSGTNIAASIFSYEPGQDPLAVDKAWSREYKINYDSDKNGAAEQNVSTVRYDAIVAPHNFYSRMYEDVIARISISNQNFSFYASNDDRLLGSATDEERAEAMDVYNLTAGKHLTVVATLSRESRKILITSWIEDWTEKATSTICDDYGKAGDPVQISTKDELIAFLNGPKNKAGNVGIMNLSSLDLEAGGPWPTEFDLNATLNLAGCEIVTSHQLFSSMSSAANLVNGSIVVKDVAIPYAVASTNEGLIERVDVRPLEGGSGTATIAGLVGENAGTIYQCSSALPVSGPGLQVGENRYIGGIAAKSVSPSQSSTAVIDACMVNASVTGDSDDVYGGGIVGYATGRISNNTYEYGISVNQPAAKYKNIFALAGNDQLQAFNNAWPTKAKNTITEALTETNPNAYTGARFDMIIKSEAELDAVLRDNLKNQAGVDVRISQDFSICSETWVHGTVSADQNTSGFFADNVLFNLDGNGKTITLTGTRQVTTTTGNKPTEGDATNFTTAPMLFNYVLGEVKNLTLFLDKPIIAQPGTGDEDVYNASDAIAALAYGVYGGNLENIDVKGADGTYIQASTPAGLVVWAFGGATITNCRTKLGVSLWLPSNMGTDAKHYAGGLVACAAKAVISQCCNYCQSSSSVYASSTSAKASQNVFLGGIVGGTVEKSTLATAKEEPLLKINDCSSWFDARRTITVADKTSKGGIIAYTVFADDGNMIVNGMADSGNEGNWWPATGIGAHTWLDGLTEEDVIGKRNSVEPQYDLEF